MPNRLASLITALLVALALPAYGQGTPSTPAMAPWRFESWQATALFDDSSVPAAAGVVMEARKRKDAWIIGGAVGAAAGIVFCTVMSTLMNDSASGGLSFCPLDTYLIVGGAGFALGAIIGLAL